ncbi:MAG: SUMF1/EgtB/PvdO family nonheme iron enzyme [Acidobacteriota bacterium]|nr:SUMF1/EgtB/PvdO family nonheme iron enzyme [Acidobacteriota bacterium]
MPKVFISYSHDSVEHSDRVLQFAWALRNHRIDVELDQFHKEEIVDWPRWCNEQISSEHSDFVICICTAEYKRRIEGNVPPEKGKGVYWEGSLLDDDLYDDKGNRRLIPILLNSEPSTSIPRFLRGWTFCSLSQFVLDDAGYEHLIRILTNQPTVEKNPLGTIPVLTTQRAPSGSPSAPQRELELAFLDGLNDESLRQLYTGMNSRSERQFRHYGDRRMKVELLPVGKDGSLQPKKDDFDDAAEAMLKIKRAALLGEPGGGKSTAIWKLAMEMAETARQNPQEPIPLVVPLREWTLADQPLRDFIASQIGKLEPHLDSLLQSHRAALLLDGLNELPVDQRRDKYDQVCRFIKEHPALMAIVSCRKEDYPPELGFDCINISPLDPLRIRRFVENYLHQVERPELAEPLFWKLAPPEAQQTLAEFLAKFSGKLDEAEQVFWLNTELPNGLRWGWEWEGKNDNSTWQHWVRQRDDSAGLMKLASNPFMLNMLIGNFVANSGELPKNRGELFKNFVQNRLNRELEDDRILPTEMEPLKDALARLAFEMQSRPAKPDAEEDGKYSGALTVLPKSEAARVLGENHQRLFTLASGAGILEIADPVRFTHQLLQEYFAARHLAIRFEARDLKASQLWPEKWWQRTNWEVAAVLFTGLYSNDCSAAVEWIAEANPEVAAQCLDRSGVGHTLNDATRQRLTKEWIERLTDLKRDPEPQARAAIGRALGLMGWDNRQGVGIVEINGVKLPDIEWIKIPEGEFQYGDAKDEYAAKPQKLWLPEFQISRYPITYAQFQTFLDDPEGFNDKRWFAGLAASEGERQMNEQSFKFANHPRDSVNWYQAMAFCRWLTWRLDQADRVSTATGRERQTNEVRLPTEFEWEKAARGTDGRLYPYKGKYDTKKANTGRIIYQTSAVGIFPNGQSPCGVEEMSGNVLEWCLNDYSDPKLDPAQKNLDEATFRVLRGGSWFFDQMAVYRYFNHAADRYSSFGFRVVAARPPSS